MNAPTSHPLSSLIRVSPSADSAPIAHPASGSELTLGRDEMAVYDALVRADAALTLDDLRASLGSVRLGCDLLSDLPDAIDSLVQDGLCWREGNLVGLVEAF